MPTCTTVYLPLSTEVAIKAFSNADSLQRVVLAPETGDAIVFTGRGRRENPIGSSSFTTPPGSISPVGFQFDVHIDYSADEGETWKRSQVFQDSCSVEHYNLKVVVSDEPAETSWNDAVVTLAWATPPPERARMRELVGLGQPPINPGRRGG